MINSQTSNNTTMFFGDMKSSVQMDKDAYARRSAFVNQYNTKVNQKLFLTTGAVPNKNYE